MPEPDLDAYDAPPRGGLAHRRPRAAGRAAVRALVARLAWTDLPRVYWSGAATIDGPAATAVQRRLTGRAAGAYAARLAPVAPPADEARDAVRLARLSAVTVAELIPVTPALLARSVRALAEARGFPKLLPAAVGDVDAWRGRCETAMAHARSAMTGQRCLVLGREPVRSRHPLGWPADTLVVAESLVGPARLLRLARSVPAAVDADVAAAVRGCLLVAPATLGPFLDALPDLIALHARVADEPARRLRATATIQGEAVAAALGATGVAGPIPLAGVRPTRHERAFLHLVRQRYQGHVTAAVDRYYRAVLPRVQGRRPAFANRADDRRGRVNVLGLLSDLFIARGLRSLMLVGELPADRRRYLRTRVVDGRILAAGPDREPLRFEALPATAAARLWSDATAGPWPRQPLPRSAVLDAAAAGSIPRAVPWVWVEACCHAWPPGATGQGAAAAVLLSLATVRRHAADPPVVCGWLDRFAGPILSHVLMDLGLLGDAYRHRRRRRLEAEIQTFCRCAAAGLDGDALHPFVDADAFGLLRAAAEQPAVDLAAFARRASAYVAEWVAGSDRPDRPLADWHLTGHAAEAWSRAFAQLGPGLLDALVRDVAPALSPDRAFVLVNRLGWMVEEAPAEWRAGQRALLTAAVPILVRRLATAGEAGRVGWAETFANAVEAVSAATGAGLPDGVDPRSLFADCFGRPPARAVGSVLTGMDPRDQAAVAALARGRADRLVAVSRLSGQDDGRESLSSDDPAQLRAGWALLGELGPSVAEGVSAAVGRDGLTLRAVRAVSRLGLCLRFHRGDDLRASLAGVAGDGEPLAELVRWRGELPGRVREAIDRPAALRRELDGLAGRSEPPAVRRAEHLRRQLADPEALADWVRRDLAKVLPVAVDEARVARLEATADAAIRGHFAGVLGVNLPAGLTGRPQRDWDNALRLYLTIDANRTRLRWLLRREARGDRAWLATEPRNAAFLAAVGKLGVDGAAWRGPMVRHAGPFRLELETDPLHVLQMGNYFGTCLSQGQFNAFSTVANATDANKRVAYVYDGRGAVVGRKLLVMTPRGQIVGFRTYGTADRADAGGDVPAAEAARAELKAALDGFCGELARRCRATLHPFADRARSAPPDVSELKLSAAWYYDGAEPFDLRHLPAAGRSKGRRSAV